MEVLIQATQFILSLSILIVLHELGHYIPAKLFNTKVEKFYLFFDAFGFSLFKFKKGETQYGIGWLPLGGYVKIAGMIDESMDKEQMKKPPQSWEFRAKPAWQRLIIMVGGVTVNVILGIFIYAMVAYAWGDKVLPVENLTYGIAVDSTGYQIGLRDGDKVLAVDGIKIKSYEKIVPEIIVNKAKTIQVERDGDIIDISLKEEIFSSLIKSQKSFIELRYPSLVDSVLPETPAQKAGLQKGDHIVSINNVPSSYYHELRKVLQSSKGEDIAFVVKRNKKLDTLSATVSKEGTLGFFNRHPLDFFEYETQKYSFIEAFPVGINKGVTTIRNYIKQFKLFFTVEDAHKSLGGFITIGKAYDTTWNWHRFWGFTAFLSMVLAFMNILPIPALDGGHVMFLLYEVITRRKPHEKVLEYAQYAGMFLLLALLLYANGNDIVRLLSK